MNKTLNLPKELEDKVIYNQKENTIYYKDFSLFNEITKYIQKNSLRVNIQLILDLK